MVVCGTRRYDVTSHDMICCDVIRRERYVLFSHYERFGYVL